MKGLESLWRPALWVGLIAVSGKILSALGGIFLAYRFGAGQATDAYLLAKSIPIGVYLILDSVVYNTFVPLLRRPVQRDALFRTLLILFFFGAAAAAAGAYFGAAQLIALLARGADAATQAEAVRLQQITAWAILYAVPASCLKAWNACQARYVAAALDGFILSGLLLLTLVAVPDYMGVTPIAIALPAAFVLLLAIQAGLGRAALRLRPRAALSELPGRYLARIMAPLVLLNGAQQVQVLLVVALAAFQGRGAVSQVNYSYAIAQIPVGVLDLILFSTFFPFAAQLAANRQLGALLRTFHGAAMALLLLSLPAALWVLILRAELVETLLARGSFSAADARVTAALLFGHALAIPAWVLEALGCRVLFALGLHRHYLGAVAVRLLFFMLLAPVCLSWLGLPGLSIAFAGSFVAGAGAAAWAVRRALPPLALHARGGPARAGALLLATAVAAAAVTGSARWFLADFGAVYPLAGSAILVAIIILAAVRALVRNNYFQAPAADAERRGDDGE